MHALLLVTMVLTQAKAAPLDISAYKDKLKALTDGQGHYYVYDGDRPYESEHAFYGDGKTFHLVPVVGGGANGTESWSVSFWDPRIAWALHGYASLAMSDSGAKYELTCGDKSAAFKAVKGEDLEKLKGATFFPKLWTRQPDTLLRDEHGTYYFVDRLRTESRADRRDFRVYMGPRGKMKLLPLKDIVDDSKGTIFATPTGDLRLVSGNKPIWISGKTRIELIDIPIDENGRMIYMDLGPYLGQKLGTPCDEFM